MRSPEVGEGVKGVSVVVVVGMALKIGIRLPARVHGEFPHRYGHGRVSRLVEELVIQGDITGRARQPRFDIQQLRQTFRRDCVKRRGVIGKHSEGTAFGIGQHAAGIAHKGINASNAGGQDSGGHNTFSTDYYGRD